MANGAALINEAMWRHDTEFRALPRLAQATYIQLLSQKDLECDGTLTLHIDLLIKGCDELTVDALWHDLKTLEAARFIFVDTDTDELLIRSYVRRASAKSPNALKSALRTAKLIASPKIRYELAAELKKLGRSDADATADEIMPEGFAPTPVQIPSVSRPYPIGTPSEGCIPSEPHPDPPVPVPYPVISSSVVGHLGGAAENADTVQTPSTPHPDAPPPKFCPSHQPDGTDAPCGRCKSYRLIYDRWLRDQDLATKQREQEDGRRALAERDARLAAETAARTQAVVDCGLCDDDGYRGATVCNHRENSTAEGRAAARAAVAAALGKDAQ